MEFAIGSRLKELRKQKGFSISDLAEKSAVSTGLISQIERDMVVPSVVNLYRIAQALGADINYFFEPTDQKKVEVIRRGDHRQIITDQGNGLYTLFSSTSKGHILDMVQVRLKGGESYSREMVTHEGEECGYCVKGELTVLIDGVEHVLYEGDSIYFHSDIPHKYLNLSEEECISIWAMTPPFF